MFIRAKVVRGVTFYQVIHGYRDGGRVRHKVVAGLGQHPTIAGAIKATGRALQRDRRARDRAPESDRARHDRHVADLSARLVRLRTLARLETDDEIGSRHIPRVIGDPRSRTLAAAIRTMEVAIDNCRWMGHGPPGPISPTRARRLAKLDRHIADLTARLEILRPLATLGDAGTTAPPESVT